MKILLITNDYPPIVSGISTVFFNIWKNLSPNENIILSPYVKNCEIIDHRMPILTSRYPFLKKEGRFRKIINLLILNPFSLYMLFQCKPRAIHAGQILSSGVVGLIFKRVFNVPYFLWVYGGETSEAYTKSRLLFSLVRRIISAAAQIITYTPYVTQ